MHHHDKGKHDHAHTHGKDEHGHHHEHHLPNQLNWAFGIAILFNLLFTLIEAGYAFWANSMGLLADAGHNLGDVVGLLLAGIANILLTQRTTARYSYGFKRTSILAALANSMILVAASSIIVYESIRKLIEPAMVNETAVIIVALIGIFINGGTALLFLRGQEDLNVRAAFLHLSYDALISFGVVISGILIYYTQWWRLDPLMGLLIVALIIRGTWDLLKNSINLILDAVPAKIDLQQVRAYFAALPGVETVHDLHIWALSTKEVALTVHLVMPEQSLHDEDYHRINHDLEHYFSIGHVTIQVEKGLHADPCGQAATC